MHPLPGDIRSRTSFGDCMKVLVADDSPFFRNMLCRSLESWGYEVVTAADGEQAERILNSPDAPRMAILDCHMPGLDGLEVCRNLRSTPRDYVYTILLSADDRQDEVLAGFALGADDYVCKPYTGSELRTRLKIGEIFVGSPSRTREQTNSLEWSNSHDELLSLWNRDSILKLAGKELSRARRLKWPFTVMLVEFLPAGEDAELADAIFREAAEKVSGAVRYCDQAGRWADRALLTLLPNCAATGGIEVHSRMQQRLAELDEATRNGFALKIGIAEAMDGESLMMLLQKAEEACEAADPECVKTEVIRECGVKQA